MTHKQLDRSSRRASHAPSPRPSSSVGRRCLHLALEHCNGDDFDHSQSTSGIIIICETILCWEMLLCFLCKHHLTFLNFHFFSVEFWTFTCARMEAECLPPQTLLMAGWKHNVIITMVTIMMMMMSKVKVVSKTWSMMGGGEKTRRVLENLPSSPGSGPVTECRLWFSWWRCFWWWTILWQLLWTRPLFRNILSLSLKSVQSHIKTCYRRNYRIIHRLPSLHLSLLVFR